MHENVCGIAFLIEELVWAALHTGKVNLDAGVESELLNSTVFEVFEFRADKSVALAGFHMQEFHD